jgi:ribosomal protein L17
VAFVLKALMFAIAAMLATSLASSAQMTRTDPQSIECRQLLEKAITRLTDAQLRTLKSCLEPLERRKRERAESAEQLLPPAERKAPLRIYGK